MWHIKKQRITSPVKLLYNARKDMRPIASLVTLSHNTGEGKQAITSPLILLYNAP
jgi:hypothetical protein